MSNAASRAQAVYNRLSRHPDGLTFDTIADEMAVVFLPGQTFDALAKLIRDGVVTSGDERPRRYRLTPPPHPDYYPPES